MYKKELLLVKIGDNYNTFEGDAKALSHLTGTRLCQIYRDGILVVATGFVVHRLDQILSSLVFNGYRVAVSEGHDKIHYEAKRYEPSQPGFYNWNLPLDPEMIQPWSVSNIDVPIDFSDLEIVDALDLLEKELQRDINIYSNILASGDVAEPLASTSMKKAEALNCSLALKHNHISYAKTQILTYKERLRAIGKQKELWQI